jgi:hypothetical protein
MSSDIHYTNNEDISPTDQRFYDEYSGLEIYGTDADADDLDVAYEDDKDEL